MKISHLIVFVVGCLTAFEDVAALDNSPNQRLITGAWSAQWVAPAQPSGADYAVYRFRKTFELSRVPAHFLIHVSADRRYRLFINGQSVSVGPQRSDPFHWRYESADLAAHLRPGKNVLAAVVWNYGEDHPYALKSLATGLIVQGDTPAEEIVNTDATWKVYRDPACSALLVDRAKLKTFIVVGPGDRVDGRAFPWGWNEPAFDDRGWGDARPLRNGMPRGVGTDVYWWLEPRTLPPMEQKLQRLGSVRRAVGGSADEKFLAGTRSWKIPAHTKASLLLDQTFETIAYPILKVSGGKGAVCRLTYAEALVDDRGEKGNRNEVDGKKIVGIEDEFVADGAEDRVFSTLLFRTYRYLEIAVETGDEPLEVKDLYGLATGYPFEQKGSFTSDNPDLERIWDVGWRTARLCAYETYTDCPYYEQLQYVGDTRIQALISLYVSGDDRLMRNAIEQFDQSRLPFGLTQSRYPSTSPQIIPTFSLFWVDMVHDYWMHRRDDAFVAGRLLGIQNVLTWFVDRIDPRTRMLGPVPYWCFVDWPDEWPWVDDSHPGGQPRGAREGGSSILSLQLAWTLQHAADLFSSYGREPEAEHYRAMSAQLLSAVRDHCWDDSRKLFSDTPEKKDFSQHANALAVLAGAISGADATDLVKRIRADEKLTQCTLYFRFYLLRAAKQVGLGDDYVGSLGPWKTMLARGLTTFAERPDPTRSDCHAWSASPNYDLLATVCGIEPAAPGFEKVRIAPHLGELTRAEGVVPHSQGLIQVRLKRRGEKLKAEITLPGALTGEFTWLGRTVPLRPGRQDVEL
jgi:alpha-L-rhamnosidase